MGIVKHDPAAGRWSAAPNELIERTDLSVEARFFVVWCLCKPPAWELRVGHIQRTLGWGEHKWLRVAAELRKTGHLVYQRSRNASGQINETLYVRPIPLPPYPGQPGMAEPRPVQPCAAGTGAYVRPSEVKTQKTKKDNNNNQIAPSREVVVSDFFVESNLLEPREIAELKSSAINMAIENPQEIVDEICGQIRKKGRTGDRGIKHPIRLLKKIATSTTLDFAADERERREAKLRPITGVCNAQQATGKGVPCPPHISAKIAQLVRGKHDQ
jgi:hypothetical protein